MAQVCPGTIKATEVPGIVVCQCILQRSHSRGAAQLHSWTCKKTHKVRNNTRATSLRLIPFWTPEDRCRAWNPPRRCCRQRTEHRKTTPLAVRGWPGTWDNSHNVRAIPSRSGLILQKWMKSKTAAPKANPGVVCLPVARKGLEGLVGVGAGEATIEDVPLTFHFASLRPGTVGVGTPNSCC